MRDTIWRLEVFELLGVIFCVIAYIEEWRNSYRLGVCVCLLFLFAMNINF